MGGGRSAPSKARLRTGSSGLSLVLGARQEYLMNVQRLQRSNHTNGTAMTCKEAGQTPHAYGGEETDQATRGQCSVHGSNSTATGQSQDYFLYIKKNCRSGPMGGSSGDDTDVSKRKIYCKNCDERNKIVKLSTVQLWRGKKKAYIKFANLVKCVRKRKLKIDDKKCSLRERKEQLDCETKLTEKSRR